jgi:hypothetical protein
MSVLRTGLMRVVLQSVGAVALILSAHVAIQWLRTGGLHVPAVAGTVYILVPAISCIVTLHISERRGLLARGKWGFFFVVMLCVTLILELTYRVLGLERPNW